MLTACRRPGPKEKRRYGQDPPLADRQGRRGDGRGPRHRPGARARARPRGGGRFPPRPRRPPRPGGAPAPQAGAPARAGRSLALPLDVTDRPAFAAFLDEVERRLGPLDILVNNAGIMPLAPLDQEDDASVTRQLEINLHAVISATKEAMRRMRPRHPGHIVNMASLAGRAAAPG